MTRFYASSALTGRCFIATAAATALATSLTVATPQAARADAGDFFAGAAAIAIIGALANNANKRKAAEGATVTRKAGGNGGVRRAAAPRDAIAMTRDQQRLIQEGLATKGFYSGSVDGQIGAGTRTSIRNWQAAMGYGVTGVLTGAQINELSRASVAYAAMGGDDPRLYGVEIARDLDRDGIRRLQAALNAAGYDAGPVDGAWGGKSRAALAAYKAREGLMGEPVPTVRVLARLEGVAMPVAAVAMAAVAGAPAAGQGDARVEAAMVADITPADVAPKVAPASALHFEIAGMRLGMIEDEFIEIIADDFDGTFVTATATAEAFGGDEVFSYAQVSTQDTWPAPGTQQIVSVYDETVPEFGAIAIYRTLILPEEVTKDTFEAAILPDLIAAYGREGMVGDDLLWLGEQSARDAAALSASAMAACGAPAIGHVDLDTPGAEAMWVDGTGPRLDTASLATVTSGCGDVLRVSFAPGMLSFALFNSDFVKDRREVLVPDAAVARVPKIKF